MVVIVAIIVICIIVQIINAIVRDKRNRAYKELENEVLEELKFANWRVIAYFDSNVTVKSRQTLEKYDRVKFFKENPTSLDKAEKIIEIKNIVSKILNSFLNNNKYESHPQYDRLVKQINVVLKNASAYRICVTYISSAGNNLGSKTIAVKQSDIDKLRNDPSLLMGKGEYSKFLKEQEKEVLSQKHRHYYECVNIIIDYANKYRDSLVVKGGQEQLDTLVGQLFDRTVNSIKKIKSIDSEEWKIIGEYIAHIKCEVENIVSRDKKILAYYDSDEFFKIKETSKVLMNSQREFNEYITEKVESISQLFGTRVVRNATVNQDEYNYIRPYQKTITPFTADVSAAVFSSAENNPIEYVVKNFYSNKALYPEQIQKLYILIEELETLKDAKKIIDNYKLEYQQYLVDVPDYVMENDEDGFYSRLGFANIDDKVLTVEYKFSYTSSGGMAQRTFTVPMTEDTIAELIRLLESKLTASAFAKEQRTLMTQKLREYIKTRDNFTCCSCGNSTHAEPNLLLEIDHIVPVSKGGRTIEDNLQTLCWKCNRAKSNKLVV